ncbi:peroxide stress protein YaaA [Nesterenkonia populi]
MLPTILPCGARTFLDDVVRRRDGLAGLPQPKPNLPGCYRIPVLIFLPPSEGKTSPAHDDGMRLDLDALGMPELAEQRSLVLDALTEASGREDAQQILKVGAKVMAEVEANRILREAPTAPAHEIYTGVLFDALDAGSLTSAELKRAEEQVLIFSGLFGATSFTDRIPAYRCSMDVKLDPLGKLGTWWKNQLSEPLAQRVGEQLIVDCRSASYAQAFRPAPEQTLVVNSFTERDGHRKVVTHFAKHARGQLAGMLLRAEDQPETIDDVIAVASQRWDAEFRPARGKTPHQLDLLTSEG